MGHHEEYEALRRSIAQRFADLREPLYTTNASELFTVFLDSLPQKYRQYYTCSACRRFVRNYGGLVTIDEKGQQKSFLWSDQWSKEFRDALCSLEDEVIFSSITGVFLTKAAVLGQPVTGFWTHLAAPRVPEHLKPRSFIKTAGQLMAEKREEHRLLTENLGAYTYETVKGAIRVLSNAAVYRGTRVLAQAQWLHEVYKTVEGKRGKERANLLWRAVASAPVGFCHVRTTVLGTVLDDVQAGLPFEMIAQRYDAKMDPLKYQRPQAAPTVGNIDQAEKIMAKMGAERSLARRFARLEDVEAYWKPGPSRDNSVPTAGIFGHLRPKRDTLRVPIQTVTWEKFKRVVLPEAHTLDYCVPNAKGAYCALITAVHPDAPSLFQWDFPISWYLYAYGSYPFAWNLEAYTWVPVTGLVKHPADWGEKRAAKPYQQEFILLQEARDLGYKSGGGFFPAQLRSEYREVRATLEAYVKNAVIVGKEEASACGVMISEQKAQFRLRVNGQDEYLIDRWD